VYAITSVLGSASDEDPSCNPNYATPPDVPCVPSQTGDFNCRDLARWGVGGITVVGNDVYHMDADGDRTACEELPNPRTNDFGAWVADHAGFGAVAAILIVVAVTIASGRWFVRLYKLADTDAERRGYRMSVATMAIAAVPLAILSVALFAMLGID
jgi:hypothetical protein